MDVDQIENGNEPIFTTSQFLYWSVKHDSYILSKIKPDFHFESKALFSLHGCALKYGVNDIFTVSICIPSDASVKSVVADLAAKGGANKIAVSFLPKLLFDMKPVIFAELKVFENNGRLMLAGNGRFANAAFLDYVSMANKLVSHYSKSIWNLRLHEGTNPTPWIEPFKDSSKIHSPKNCYGCCSHKDIIDTILKDVSK